jgi:hypothetical protein
MMMKLLNIVKTEPNETTQKIMDSLDEGKEVTRWNLYENTDYDKLVAEIFAHDEVISWW